MSCTFASSTSGHILPSMSVWTNGVVRLIATPQGIARSEGGAYEITPNPPRGRKRELALEDVDLFVITDAAGEVALYRQKMQPLQVWRRGTGFTACDTARRSVESVASTPNGLVAIVADADGRTLVRASLDGDALHAGEPIAVPEASRVGVVDPFFLYPWAETDIDPSFDARRLASAKDGHLLGAVRLFANPFGLAMTSTYSGLVAVFDASTLKPKLAVLLPTQRQQFDLYAVAVADGVFVTVVVNGRHSLHLHLGVDGAPVASRKAFGKEEANGEGHALVLGKRVLVNQGRDGGVQQLGLGDLKPKLFRDHVRVVASSSASDGRAHLVELTGPAGENREWKLLRDGGPRLQTEECEAPSFASTPEAADTSAMPKVTGPANLGVAAISATPWIVAASASTRISLNVTNRGGASKGLWVELGGPAIAAGHVEPIAASIDGSTAALAPRAELVEANLEAASAPPQQKGPQPPIPLPAITLEVELRGKLAGSALLTVRVGPLGATGSAMCGRPFEVTS